MCSDKARMKTAAVCRQTASQSSTGALAISRQRLFNYYQNTTALRLKQYPGGFIAKPRTLPRPDRLIIRDKAANAAFQNKLLRPLPKNKLLSPFSPVRPSSRQGPQRRTDMYISVVHKMPAPNPEPLLCRMTTACSPSKARENCNRTHAL